MAVVASSVGVAILGAGAAGTIGAGLLGGAVLGAGIGGLYSAFTGDGDILNSMLTGGLLGGAAGGIGAAVAPAATTTAGGLTATGAGSLYPTTASTAVPALTGGGGLTAASIPSVIPASLGGAAAPVATGVGGLTAASIPSVAGTLGATGAGSTAAGLTGGEMLGYGLAGTTAMQLLGGKGKGANAPASATDPGNIRPYTFSPNQMASGDFPSPYATAQYDAAGMPIMDTRERNYFDQKYTALTPYSARAGTENPNVPVAAATGGLMAIGGPVERMTQNMMGGQGNMYPLSQQDHTNFATPTQMPASAEVIRSDYDSKTQPYTGVMMANGGKTRDKSTDNFSFDDLTKAQKEYYLDLMASPMKGEMPLGSNVGPENTLEKYMMSQAPQGFTGRVGATKFNDDGSNLRAGLSGVAMAQPGKPGITAIPGAYDVGYRSPRKSDEDSYLDLSAYRSINSVPGRGYERGINARYTIPFAVGGDVGGTADLGDYSDGGRLLKGPGDGVSDDIPATIAGKQPARLADGEFVIPARIVSEIGNGSTDAGAKRLYAMMDRIQAGRKKTIGKGKIAKDTKAKKHLLA
jgi:hypothetical protein